MSDASSDPSDKTAKSAGPGGGVTWGPLTAVLFSALGLFVAQVVAVSLISAGAQALGLSVGAGVLESIGAQFIFVLVSDGLIMLALWLLLRRKHTGFRVLGFGRRAVWRDVGYALLGVVAYFVLLVVVMGVVNAVIGVDVDKKQELGFDSVSSSTDKLLALVSLVVLPPLVEEIIFRGFLYGGLRKKLHMAGAAIITSLLFAAPHLLATSDGLLWTAAIDTFVLSLVLCYLREKTGALWASIMVHALKNGVAFCFFITTVASH